MIIKQKDKMWHVKTVCEIIMAAIMILCWIGFAISCLLLATNEDLANNIMGCSVCIGIVNFLVMVSRDNNWRLEYRDTHNAEQYD